MTLSPEDLAKAVVEQLTARPYVVIYGALAPTPEALIATAIRQACNEKLEEAAGLADRHNVGGYGRCEYDSGGDSTAGAIAEEIRSLKEPTP
jgi:hypothetical protein